MDPTAFNSHKFIRFADLSEQPHIVDCKEGKILYSDRSSCGHFCTGATLLFFSILIPFLFALRAIRQRISCWFCQGREITVKEIKPKETELTLFNRAMNTLKKSRLLAKKTLKMRHDYMTIYYQRDNAENVSLRLRMCGYPGTLAEMRQQCYKAERDWLNNDARLSKEIEEFRRAVNPARAF